MYMIYVENTAGDIVRVISWSGSKEEGIHRMRQEAKEKNISVKKVWAEFVKKTA